MCGTSMCQYKTITCYIDVLTVTSIGVKSYLLLRLRSLLSMMIALFWHCTSHNNNAKLYRPETVTEPMLLSQWLYRSLKPSYLKQIKSTCRKTNQRYPDHKPRGTTLQWYQPKSKIMYTLYVEILYKIWLRYVTDALFFFSENLESHEFNTRLQVLADLWAIIGKAR